MRHALVTGASGFIGNHLVKQLSDRGTKVTCLVRPTTEVDRLKEMGVEFAVGNVTELDSVRRALSGTDIDTVFHLAGLTKSLRSEQMMHANREGCRCVAAACADAESAPRLVVVSSLAAAGPDPKNEERDSAKAYPTVSAYGASKRAGEVAAIEFASKVPMTIVRPPIVLGQGDREGLTMYQSIDRYRCHLVPCLSDKRYSVIHATDLANACIAAAENGKRILNADSAQGVYFAAADEVYTYAGLGRAIAGALGRKVLNIRFPSPAVWVVAGVSEAVARLRGKASLLNLDKAREATSVSWTCNANELKNDTGFKPAVPFVDRLSETVDWYRKHDWL